VSGLRCAVKDSTAVAVGERRRASLDLSRVRFSVATFIANTSTPPPASTLVRMRAGRRAQNCVSAWVCRPDCPLSDTNHDVSCVSAVDVLHPESKQQTTPAAPRDALERVAALARTRECRQNCVRFIGCMSGGEVDAANNSKHY
jgi:hypothetical protein